MKFVFMLLLSMVVLYSMGPGANIGGMGKGNMKNMQNSYGMKAFRKSTIITIEATVEKVGNNELNSKNSGRGLHLYVKSNRGYYKIHVSPQFWIDLKNITFSKGEKLTVTGSKFQNRGENNMYVVNIVKNGKQINFRDPETGDGLWKNGMVNEMKNKRKNQQQKNMQEKMMKQMQKKMMSNQENIK